MNKLMPAILLLLSFQGNAENSEYLRLKRLNDRLQLTQWLPKYVGITERATTFNWREKTMFQYSEDKIFELNAFLGDRKGLLVRYPSREFIIQGGVSYVNVKETDVSSELAKTMLRQVGRPSRFEIESGIEWVLCEGIGHTIFPVGATQFSFSMEGKLRYLVYGRQKKYSLNGFLFEKFEDLELPSGMLGDSNRFNMAAGIRVDHYYTVGISTSFHLLFASTPTGSMVPWWEGGLGIAAAL